MLSEIFWVRTREVTQPDDAESLMRKPEERGAITEQRAAVFDSRQTAVV